MRFYKKIVPRSLFGRSLLIIVLPILLTMIITTIVFFDRHWSTTTQRLTNSLAGEIASVIEEAETKSENVDILFISNRAFKNFGFKVYFDSEPGTKYLNSFVPHSFSVKKVLSDALIEKDVKNFTVTSRIKNNRDLIQVFVKMNSGMLIFEIPEKRIFSSTTYIFLLTMIGGGFILMIIAIIFMRNQIRPVRRLAVAAEKLGKGEDVPRFKLEGAREIRQAANAFLTMRERIKRQIRQRTEMLAGVSHDLRTPLTRLKLQLALLDEDDDILDMKDDITSMEQMIDGYLAFARGDDDEETVAVNLKSLLLECVEDAQRHNQIIDFNDDHADHHLRLRYHAMKRLFQNLISNADKYASQCWIRVIPLNNALEIWIEDDGPGISDDQIEQVFRPFYRIDSARNIDKGGVGLGLSIARDIAMNHGGNIRLEKSGHGGLKAVVRLPL